MTESPKSNPAVSLQSVSFAYNTEPVLTNATFELRANEITCIVGPNGGGKTTLLRLILGQIKPDQGRVTVFGQSPSRVRQRVGYVPQQALYDPQFPVSVKDVVLMGRLGRQKTGLYSGADHQAAAKALAEVQLNGLENHAFADLSGGQRQRVLIARALASTPDLLLLDEPTASVDRAAAQRVYQLLADLSQRVTVVFVSHDIGVVSNIVNRVLCVNRGVALHETRQITNEALSRLYGGDMSWIEHDQCCTEEEHHHD